MKIVGTSKAESWSWFVTATNFKIISIGVIVAHDDDELRRNFTLSRADDREGDNSLRSEGG